MSTSDEIQQSTPFTRMLLLAASILVLVVFLNIFFLTEKTDEFFAWTVNPPITGAFIGAGYGAACILEYLASRKRYWAESRVALYGVVAFSFLMLLATVMHRDRFHFDAENWYTEAGTWFWLLIYASVPLMLSVAAFDQWQQPGGDPARTRPISRPVRLLIFALGLLFVQIGALLFIAPEQTAVVWPWTLTALTGRTMAAWVVGIGVTIIQVARDADWEWARPAIYSYACFVILIAIGVIRYNDSIAWDEIQIWLFWALWLAPLLVIGYGWQASKLEK
jgi:hypothetical protein